MKLFFILIIIGILTLNSFAQNKKHQTKTGNPVLPGWFADPTIKKFDDTYYIYATTDNEMLASGAPTVWYSNDLKHWYNYIMEVPSLEAVTLRNFWAPDIVKGDGGRYYLYFGNCQAGCNIYGYVSDTPVGPWRKLHENDAPVIANGYPRQNYPSLDAQFFRDNDGTIYGYWGTWVHCNGGYAVGVLNRENMGEMSKAKNIPVEQTPNPFEAAYMLKKGDKYILMYSAESCHNETYKVLYAYADSPYGPFHPGKNNPVLQTNADGTVNGPGHHSVLQEGNKYYIVYHRHDYPFTRGGMARQVCMDELIFENDSTLKAVVPTNQGIRVSEKTNLPEDLACGAKATASSYYHLQSPDYDYRYAPKLAFDANNATMWKAAGNTFPQSLSVDLGKITRIGRVCTEFEFAQYYYQYKIEYSVDSKSWRTFVDRTANRIPGSPMVDDANVEARYLKLTVLATEKIGTFAAVWNMHVYGSDFELPLCLTNKPSENEPEAASTKSMLVGFELGRKLKRLEKLPNIGTLGGNLVKQGDVEIVTDKETRHKVIEFKKGELILEEMPVPGSLAWNGAFSVAVWVKNPDIDKKDECLASWCDRTEYYLANTFNAPFYNRSNYGAVAHLDGHFDMPYKKLPAANEWHHIVLTFDGVVEKVYVDGKLDNAQNMLLSSAVKNAKIRIGASDIGEYYTGFMASFRLYDYALCTDDISELFDTTKFF